MPISEDQAFLVARATACDRDGTRIGRVVGIYSDNHTGRPEWVTIALEDVTSGGAAEPPVRFAPLASGSYARGQVSLDVTRDQVVAAPVVSEGDDLDGGSETLLYTHYGLSPAGDTNVDPTSGTTPRSREADTDHSLIPPAER